METDDTGGGRQTGNQPEPVVPPAGQPEQRAYRQTERASAAGELDHFRIQVGRDQLHGGSPAMALLHFKNGRTIVAPGQTVKAARTNGIPIPRPVSVTAAMWRWR